MKVVWSEGVVEDISRLLSRNLRYSIPRGIDCARMGLRFAWQRVFRGYDDGAMWGLNSHVAKVSREVLVWMKTNGHGYPTGLSEKEWNDILGIMIKGFEAYEHISGFDVVETRKTHKGRMNLIAKWERELDDGMKLYAKYFLNLWD